MNMLNMIYVCVKYSEIILIVFYHFSRRIESRKDIKMNS